MNDVIRYSFLFLYSMLLGTVFFGGLWWTVKKGLSIKHPAMWFMLSFVLRFGVVVSGFLIVLRGHWERLAIAMTGFLIARLLITYFTREILPLREAEKEEDIDETDS